MQDTEGRATQRELDLSGMNAYAFYQQQLRNVEEERMLIQKYSDILSPNHKEIHSLKWVERYQISYIL